MNGRVFGPLELGGASFTASSIAHAEELELDFGPVQLQEISEWAAWQLKGMLSSKGSSWPLMWLHDVACRRAV